MKQLFFIAITILLVSFAKAQSIENIKLEFQLAQNAKAKTDIDKLFADPKFVPKAEAYLLKSCIYAALAMEQANKGTSTSLQLAADAATAFYKYKELEPSLALLADGVYQNGLTNLYYAYYTNGYNDYAEKKWAIAFEKLKKAVEFSDILIAKKVLPFAVDTNVLILAGVTAENSGNKDDVARYYSRLADIKIGGDGFESVYRYLVNYYFEKKNTTAFEKYKAIGAQLYPQSEYFKFDKIDFAVGLATNFTDKLKLLEEILLSDPNNFKANQVLGEIIYDTLNSDIPGAVPPSNFKELEIKMVAAFNKSAAARSDYENPYIYIGDHFINKAAKIGEEKEAHLKLMKDKVKPGSANAPEDIAKRDKLEKQYAEELEAARLPYEKAAAILATKPYTGTTKLERINKQQYKKVCGYLADIYAYKKVAVAAKSKTDAAAFEAQEKKWTALYESIK